MTTLKSWDELLSLFYCYCCMWMWKGITRNHATRKDFVSFIISIVECESNDFFIYKMWQKHMPIKCLLLASTHALLLRTNWKRDWRRNKMNWQLTTIDLFRDRGCVGLMWMRRVTRMNFIPISMALWSFNPQIKWVCNRVVIHIHRAISIDNRFYMGYESKMFFIGALVLIEYTPFAHGSDDDRFRRNYFHFCLLWTIKYAKWHIVTRI